jgi:hypothetical protein
MWSYGWVGEDPNLTQAQTVLNDIWGTEGPYIKCASQVAQQRPGQTPAAPHMSGLAGDTSLTKPVHPKNQTVNEVHDYRAKVAAEKRLEQLKRVRFLLPTPVREVRSESISRRDSYPNSARQVQYMH